MAEVSPRIASQGRKHRHGIADPEGPLVPEDFRDRMVQRMQSKLTKVIGMPIYKSMTIRNWNTTTKLLGLMQQAD